MFYDRPKKRNKAARERERAEKARPRARKAAADKKNRRGFAASRKPAAKKAAPQKRNPHPRRRHTGLKLALCVLLMLFLAFGALYVLPVSALGRHQAPGAAVPLPSGYTHVLLIGADMDASGTSRSDTMVICSVGEGRVLLTSLQRDTGVIIPGYSGLSRLNAAYHYGGAKLLLETVNRNFGLDLSLYALVDYDSFPPLIDALGGVDIAGITNEEANQVNATIYELLLRQYKQGVLNKEQAQKEFLRLQLKCGGDLHLNGAKALGYARIRKTDSDYGRTLRQRKVLSAAIRSLKSSGPFSVTRFALKCFRALETNMNTLELISLGEKALFSSEIQQFRLPVNGSFTDSGSMFYDVDYARNREEFLFFVYGQ